MSAVGSPTEGLSELGDHFIQRFAPNTTSYIRDTQDFIDKLHATCPFPIDSISCTVDVTVPFPSMPHDDGLDDLRNALLIMHIGQLVRMSVLDTEVDGSNPGSSMLFP